MVRIIFKKLSKTQLHKIGQSGGFLGRLLGSLLKPGLPLMKNVLKPFGKGVLIPLGLTAAASATKRKISWYFLVPNRRGVGIVGGPEKSPKPNYLVGGGGCIKHGGEVFGKFPFLDF